MKKVLLASTALVLSAGVAAADFKIGGTARAGITYDDTRAAETQVNMRLRFNIDAVKELDSGVTLGGRIRLQYDQGRQQDNSSEGGAEVNAAYLYASTGGLRVEVGNVNTAFDSMSLLYNSELGYVGTTQAGYAQATYTSYQTNPYSGAQGTANRMGLFASYTVGDLVARFSYVNPDQNAAGGTTEEISVSFDYTAGAFKVGLGFAKDGRFIDGNDVFALTGEYAINDGTSIGLQYLDNGSANSETTTLYGRTTFSGVQVGAFIGFNDNAGPEDVSYGIGASYDLGGATLAGTIQKGFADNTYADLGIRFSF